MDQPSRPNVRRVFIYDLNDETSTQDDWLIVIIVIVIMLLLLILITATRGQGSHVCLARVDVWC